MPAAYERIEELCKERKITVTLMCRQCGIPRSSLSDYKTGRVQSLSAKALAKIADYFGVSVDYLYGGESPAVERELKVALFGGDGEVTDEMWNEVKRYAQYVKEKGRK
jgi:transcriptional regulator with XRE-family HTH domain